VARILIAEDDVRVSSFVERGLKARGYSTLVVPDGERAESLGLTDEFDLLILDIGLPEREGLHVLQALRARGSRLPVVVLTGRPDQGAAACLDGGADDFMTKPFDLDELIARVRARLREAGTDEPPTLSLGDVRLDLKTRRASVGELTADLTLREFSLLETFLRHPGQVLTRAQIASQVWGYLVDPNTNLVCVYVGALRRKLGDHVIETVRGEGYRLGAR
jgi:DNA-binding response OmpR family regulator